MGLDEITPALKILYPPTREATNLWWYEGSIYFFLTGIFSALNLLTEVLAVQQARWANYGVVSTYDKVYFWTLNAFWAIAALGYAKMGYKAPSSAYGVNTAAMVLSQLLK
jgi:hypothetical protein